MEDDAKRIVAVGLLTSAELQLVGPSLRRIFPISPGTDFADLLHAIEEADQAMSASDNRLD